MYVHTYVHLKQYVRIVINFLLIYVTNLDSEDILFTNFKTLEAIGQLLETIVYESDKLNITVYRLYRALVR